MTTKETSPLQFDLVDLPDEGKSLAGTVLPQQLKLEDESRRRFLSPVRFALRLQPINSGHDLLVQGELSGEVGVVCDRCDRDFVWEFHVSDVCHEYENAFGKTIDLTELLREDILLDFPQFFLCDDDCKGLCHRCGANLNDGPCGCPADAETEEWPEETGDAKPSQEENPWAALDTLELGRQDGEKR